MAKRLRNTAPIQYECEGNCDGNMMGPYPCVVCTKYVDGVPVGMEMFPAGNDGAYTQAEADSIIGVER